MRRPPRFTLTDPPFPDTTLFRSQDEGRKRYRVDRRPVARRHNAAGKGEARGKKDGDEEQKRVAGQREIVRYGSRDPADEVADDQTKRRPLTLFPIMLAENRDDDDQNDNGNLCGIQDEPGQDRTQDEGAYSGLPCGHKNGRASSREREVQK